MMTEVHHTYGHILYRMYADTSQRHNNLHIYCVRTHLFSFNLHKNLYIYIYLMIHIYWPSLYRLVNYTKLL